MLIFPGDTEHCTKSNLPVGWAVFFVNRLTDFSSLWKVHGFLSRTHRFFKREREKNALAKRVDPLLIAVNRAEKFKSQVTTPQEAPHPFPRPAVGPKSLLVSLPLTTNLSVSLKRSSAEVSEKKYTDYNCEKKYLIRKKVKNESKSAKRSRYKTVPRNFQTRSYYKTRQPSVDLSDWKIASEIFVTLFVCETRVAGSPRPNSFHASGVLAR